MSDDQLRAEIKALPREQVGAAFEWLRKRAWITKEKVTSDIDKWSPMLLGTISGVIDVTSKGLTQPSALEPKKENAQ